MDEINRRRTYTENRIIELQNQLTETVDLLGNNACIYATGSFGRLEAAQTSDLDGFIVGLSQPLESGNLGPAESRLTRLDEICVKADLIEATRILSFPDFDGDGKYLAHYSASKLSYNLGRPEDDAENTLTSRLLLFLESKPLIGESVYNDVIKEVIAAYWNDYEGHKKEFMPAFLTNDILRLWRTFCVNYEARTSNTPEPKRIKRKIKNYKLKHNRMLTCYSAILFLVGVLRKESTVSVDRAFEMSQKTPTDRLRWLLEDNQFDAAHVALDKLMNQYEKFLESTKNGDSALYDIFSDKEKGNKLMEESYQFGDLMYEVLSDFENSCTSDIEKRYIRLTFI
jgi:hypothetical protein